MDVFVRTIDVQIVDLADEIAYCAHDLEDALASNYFTIDQFVFLLEQKLGEDQTLEDFKEWIEEAKIKKEVNPMMIMIFILDENCFLLL